MPDLAVVVVERLKVLVDVSNGASEAQVEGPENTNIPTRKHRTATSMLCQLKSKGSLKLFDWIKNTVQEPISYNVSGDKEASVLVILVLDELDYDVLVWLDLQHLEREAEERGGLAVAAVGSAGVVELHGLVDQRLRGEAEALLLPVGALVDLCAHDLLHQVLWVRPVDALREGVRAVRHRLRAHARARGALR